MKPHEVGTANRRKSNIEPQNFEGWFRVAQSFLLNRQNTFIRHSIFDIHNSIFVFLKFPIPIKLGAISGWDSLGPPLLTIFQRHGHSAERLFQ